MTSPLRLGDYVDRVYFQNTTVSSPEVRPFGNSGPLLRPRGVNRILLFPGSFNPPHRGHLELLTHVFCNAGDDLHLAAAIIIPSDDRRLADKYVGAHDSLILDKAKRVGLWRAATEMLDWAWVFDRSEAAWDTFRRELEARLRLDGIEIKFVLLGGPDLIGAASIHDPTYWRCADAVTSDVSRPVDYRYPNSLRQLAGCSPWEKPRYDYRRLEAQIRERMCGESQQAADGAVAQAVGRIQAASICERLRKPRGWIRFVPCEHPGVLADAPSSTQIRALAAACEDDGALELELARLALSPRLLARYLREQRGAGEAAESEPVLT